MPISSLFNLSQIPGKMLKETKKQSKVVTTEVASEFGIKPSQPKEPEKSNDTIDFVKQIYAPSNPLDYNKIKEAREREKNETNIKLDEVRKGLSGDSEAVKKHVETPEKKQQFATEEFRDYRETIIKPQGDTNAQRDAQRKAQADEEEAKRKKQAEEAKLDAPIEMPASGSKGMGKNRKSNMGRGMVRPKNQKKVNENLDYVGAEKRAGGGAGG